MGESGLVDDDIMEEENELKLLVKNVAKKLTYEEDEQMPQLNSSSDQDEQINSKSGQFYLMISDEEEMGDQSSNNCSVNSKEISDEFEFRELSANIRSYDPNLHGQPSIIKAINDTRIEGGQINPEDFRAKLQEKLRNLNLSSLVSQFDFVTYF